MVHFFLNASFFYLTASKTVSKNEGRKTEGNLNQCKKTRVKNEGNAAVFWEVIWEA